MIAIEHFVLVGPDGYMQLWEIKVRSTWFEWKPDQYLGYSVDHLRVSHLFQGNSASCTKKLLLWFL